MRSHRCSSTGKPKSSRLTKRFASVWSARLAKRPRWVAGLGFDVGGYAVQWWALTIGSLVLVQPLLVLGLLFALPIKARFAAYRFHGWDWAGALLTTAGLAVFLVVSRPAAGHTNVSAVTWTMSLSAAGVLAGALVASAAGAARGGRRWPTARPAGSSTGCALA